MAKRKSSFKSLPKRAKRAAFASMTAKGTIRPKSKSGKRTGGGLGLSFGTRRGLYGLAKESVNRSGVMAVSELSGSSAKNKFAAAAAKKINSAMTKASASKPLFVGQSALSGKDRTALKRGAFGGRHKKMPW